MWCWGPEKGKGVKEDRSLFSEGASERSAEGAVGRGNGEAQGGGQESEE